MSLTPSTETPAGTQAPAFTLPEPASGKTVSLQHFADSPVCIIFMCNHCPYVVHIIDALVSTAEKLATMGIKTVAISSNDAAAYPADGPDNMAALAQEKNFSFPYLYDESQSVAIAYGAQCTPDLYLFDAQHLLYYRGQFDSSRPGSGKAATGDDLMAAARQLAAGEAAPANPMASVGCSIKWKNRA